MNPAPARFAMLDLDGTLVDSVGPLRKWAQRLCAEYGLPAGTAEWVIEQRDSYASWQTFVGAAADYVGRPEESAEWRDHLVRNYPHEFTLDPDTAERLTSLRTAGWKLAIVTNGGVGMQTAKIGQVGLHDYVDAICISEAEGVRKPDRAIFERAAARLGVELGSHGWMVGDTLTADVEGGIAAGVRTIWLSDAQNSSGAAAGSVGGGLGEGLELRPEHVCGSIVAALDHILTSV
jgi:HAD superfamily hydrolase (TIGR01509 family)